MGLTEEERAYETENPYVLTFEQDGSIQTRSHKSTDIRVVKLTITLSNGSMPRLREMGRAMYGDILIKAFSDFEVSQCEYFPTERAAKSAFDVWNTYLSNLNSGDLKRDCDDLFKGKIEWTFFMPVAASLQIPPPNWILPYDASSPQEMLRIFSGTPMRDPVTQQMDPHRDTYRFEFGDDVVQGGKRSQSATLSLVS